MVARPRLVTAFLVLLGPVAMTGCPPAYDVDIEDGSDSESLRFSVSEGTRGTGAQFNFFVVQSCRSIYSDVAEEFWRLEFDGGEPVTEVTYGVVPPGYLVRVAALPLPNKECFAVAYGGAEELYFATDSTAVVRRITQAEAKQRVESGRAR